MNPSVFHQQSPPRNKVSFSARPSSARLPPHPSQKGIMTSLCLFPKLKSRKRLHKSGNEALLLQHKKKRKRNFILPRGATCFTRLTARIFIVLSESLQLLLQPPVRTRRFLAVNLQSPPSLNPFPTPCLPSRLAQLNSPNPPSLATAGSD